MLLGFLFVDADELQRSKEACGLGYKHWFQNEMGNVLIDEGMRISSELKLKSSALKVTTFLRIALAKKRVAKMKADRLTPQVFVYTFSHPSIIRTHITTNHSHNTHTHANRLSGEPDAGFCPNESTLGGRR